MNRILTLHLNSIRNNEREIAYVLQHSGASVILVDEEFAHLLPKDLSSNITVIISKDSGGKNGIESDQYESFLHKGKQEWEKAEKEEIDRWGKKAKRGWELIEAPKDENIPCCLCYTSGTTGRPKGVLTSHRGSYLAACANAFEFHLTNDSVYLWVLPAFHAAGWTFPWAVTAALGTHYIIRKVDNDLIWNALNDHGITHYCAAPTVNIGLVNHSKAKKLNQLVRVAVAASAPTAELLQSLENLNIIPVHCYGQTENYGPFVKRYMQPSWSKLSVQERAQLIARQGHGFLVSDEVRVIKSVEQDSNQITKDQRDLIDVEPNGQEVGEIIMRGNLAMLEYFNDKEATNKTIKHGWLHTGDLAVRHPGGEIHIRDRQKDIIISGGENISSLAVEDEIASHEAVLEGCVVARPHEKWGEVGHAFIVLKKGKKVDAEELKKYCRSRMSKFAVPAFFDFVDALPKTSTGKVQKNVLREKLRSSKL